MCFHHSSLAKRKRGAQRCWLLVRALSSPPTILPVPNLWRSWGPSAKPVHHWRVACRPCRKQLLEEAAAARAQLGDLNQPIITPRDVTSLVPPSPLAQRWEQYLLCQVKCGCFPWPLEKSFSCLHLGRRLGTAYMHLSLGSLTLDFMGNCSAWSFWVLYVVQPDPLLSRQSVLCLHGQLRDFMC